MSRHRHGPSPPDSRWLLIHCGSDSRPHVMLASESNRHTTSSSCPCGTRIEAGVVMHAMLTSAYRLNRPMRGEDLWH